MKKRFFLVAFTFLIALGAMTWIVYKSSIAQDEARQKKSPLSLCLADPKKKPANLPAASAEKQPSSRP
ncbi:MAG TPA: hypothetical protein VKO67_02650, partial [Smithellaceae bacterium]|nr:hypothetical protein [Smithellaceae bacterium]